MSGPNFLRNWQHNQYVHSSAEKTPPPPPLYKEISASKTKPSQVSSSVKGVASSGGQQTMKGAFQSKLNPNSPRALECT